MAIDPRWWRVSRLGTAPMRAIEAISVYSALAVVTRDGEPCGVAGLVDVSGTATCALLDVLALPGHEDVVTATTEELILAAFAASQVRHLYLERFDGDPDHAAGLDYVEHEVRLPEFAYVGGRLCDRIVTGMSRSEFFASTGHDDPPDAVTAEAT